MKVWIKSGFITIFIYFCVYLSTLKSPNDIFDTIRNDYIILFLLSAPFVIIFVGYLGYYFYDKKNPKKDVTSKKIKLLKIIFFEIFILTISIFYFIWLSRYEIIGEVLFPHLFSHPTFKYRFGFIILIFLLIPIVINIKDIKSTLKHSRVKKKPAEGF